MNDNADLPGILATIAEVAGRAAALQVAAAKGGSEKVYVPRPERLRPDHWLVQTVGLANARKIAGAIGGGRIDFPLGPFAGSRNHSRKALDQALAAGKSTATAAHLAGVHQRTARRRRNAVDLAPAKATHQLDLELPLVTSRR